MGPGKKSVERGSTFKSRAGKLPKQVAKNNPSQRNRRHNVPASASGWTQRVTTLYGRRCLVCRKAKAAQGHHVVPRTVIMGYVRLPKKVRARLEYDARNGLPICVACHAAHEGGSRRIPFASIPQGALEWADENGLYWYIRKTAIYPRDDG